MNRKGYDEQTWFTFSYSPIRDDVGRIAGMFCACHETTRRVLAERALRELNDTLERRVSEAVAERKLLADIVEGTNAFVQVVDLEYRWLAVNKSAADEFERIFGKRPQVGACMLDLLADRPQQQAAVRAIWSRALAGEEFTAIDEFGDPSRDRRYYEMRYNTLRDAEGRRLGAYQFVYDVTERLRDQERLRQAEEALRQAQRLESLGQLTGGVAHDFNNLLAVFASAAQVLERNPTAEQRQSILEAMRRAVARGTGLTRHLLAFSRRRPVNPESVDLAAHIATMREMLASSLRGDIRIEMKFDADLWPVEVDAGEMELAIVNLCVNARDAMTAGGTIKIAARNVDEMPVDGSPAQMVQLSVADTGAGIPSELMGRVFDPFFTTKDVGKGSGLGLAQVYGFAQQSRGRVSIESEVGAGTVVTLLLPRSSRPPMAAQKVDELPVVPRRPARHPATRQRPARRRRQRGRSACPRDAGCAWIQRHPRLHRGRCARRARERTTGRGRLLGRHDAWRHKRSRPGTRGQAAPSASPDRPGHGLRGIRQQLEGRRISPPDEAVQPGSARALARGRIAFEKAFAR